MIRVKKSEKYEVKKQILQVSSFNWPFGSTKILRLVRVCLGQHINFNLMIFDPTFVLFSMSAAMERPRKSVTLTHLSKQMG